MRRARTLAAVWAASGPDCPRAVALSALLLLLERGGALLLANELLAARRAFVVVAGGALMVLYAARAMVRGSLRSNLQERLHQATARALLGGDLLRASPLTDEDAQGAVLDGAVVGSRFVAEVVPDLVGDTIVATAVAIAFVWVEPFRLVVAGLLALATATASAFFLRQIVRRAEARAWNLHGAVVDDLVAVLSGRVEIIANGREATFLAHAEQRLAVWRRESLRTDRLGMIIGRLPIVAAVATLALVAGAALSPERFVEHAGLMEAAVIVTGIPAFMSLARAFHELARIDTHVRAMAEILEGPAGEHARCGLTLPAPAERVELCNVGFRYVQLGRPALTDVSFAWSRGAPLVLAGPNGAGKSTTLRLLLGLAAPTSGSIRIGDHDLRELDGAAWRRGIAYLAQRPYLSDRATVREAIQLLAPAATDAEMRAVLEKVEVWAPLAASSSTPLDVRIGTLSVGQRQRVALARVLAVDAPILLLDEPDANLDHAGILTVRAIVRELSSTKMIAVVAHTEELFDLAGTLVRLS